ncbi:unnamed protein product [Pseudo-nitzschia multistriata]|uniref:Tubulin--tyrosine ligase-like protein 5 n=1 Tax=Pseudo-nitzschia multistriata TaxID=183589 RepID=A0A448ZEQ8_9STRA|nr:unnamed protein product [Pseudo-nitzschia multistriata]
MPERPFRPERPLLALAMALAVAIAALARGWLSCGPGPGRRGFHRWAEALSPGQRSALVRARIQRGMRLSEEAGRNVTAAEEACAVWERVLSSTKTATTTATTTEEDGGGDPPSSPQRVVLAPGVRSLCETLYASCLVRVGRDAEALSVYDSCLEGASDPLAAAGSRLARARCLQRLLEYSSAADEYLRVSESLHRPGESESDAAAAALEKEARSGAAACILRSSWDVGLARRVLVPDRAGAPDDEALLLSSCLGYIETGRPGGVSEALGSVLGAGNPSDRGAPAFLLYRWIAGVLGQLHRGRAIGPPPGGGGHGTNPEELFGELVRINTSPLDDPDLVRLDDKIELHYLLTAPHEGLPPPDYWPEGLVLPDSASKPGQRATGPEKRSDVPAAIGTAGHSGKGPLLWISKSRAGYGSHGNRILTFAEANEEVENALLVREHNQAGNEPPAKDRIDRVERAEPYLLQRMVEPLLLLSGYKFSLRIYVVYFSSSEAYISSEGLVKLASTPLVVSVSGEENETGGHTGEPTAVLGRDVRTDPSMHMTNSGREAAMRQEDLGCLWRALDGEDNSSSGSSGAFEKGRSSTELWENIRRVAADTLMVRYPKRISGLDGELDSGVLERKERWRGRREELGIPKILGLDFVVEAHRLQPWLVEVNRFPGLEPRDDADRKIKYRVVRDAWKRASERLDAQPMGGGGNKEERGAFLDESMFDSLSRDGDSDQASSLERLECKN